MRKAIVLISLFFFLASDVYPIPSKSIRVKVEYVMICKSKSAYAYHTYPCRGLKRCTHDVSKVTKSQTIRIGYKACKICY